MVVDSNVNETYPAVPVDQIRRWMRYTLFYRLRVLLFEAHALA
jgi:hypothetical protein